jgi:hypothetical protein
MIAVADRGDRWGGLRSVGLSSNSAGKNHRLGCKWHGHADIDGPIEQFLRERLVNVEGAG